MPISFSKMAKSGLFRSILRRKGSSNSTCSATQVNERSSSSGRRSSLSRQRSKLRSMLKSERWSSVIGALDKLESEEGGDLMLEGDSMQQNALHLACQSNPPLEVIQRLVDVCPSCVHQRDYHDQTPLHIATMYGANPCVIKFLISKYPEAAGSSTCRLQTPLMLACQSWMSYHAEVTIDFLGDEVCDTQARHFEVVRALCDAAPEVVNMEDCEGRCALEYLVEQEAPRNVFRFVQKVSERSWKRKTDTITSKTSLLRRSTTLSAASLWTDNGMKHEENEIESDIPTYKGRVIPSEVVSCKDAIFMRPSLSSQDSFSRSTPNSFVHNTWDSKKTPLRPPAA